MDDPLRSMAQELLLKRDPSGEQASASTVILREENREAATIYMLTRNQVVTAGQGQVLDLSIPAVKIAMELHGVADQKACLAQVLRTFHHFEARRQSA